MKRFLGYNSNVFNGGNRLTKYLIYAVGEILLVVIGILIALQVNNWNESRKERVQEIKSYENLVVSLSADSTEVEWVIEDLLSGMRAQKFIISHSAQELINNFTLQQIKDSLITTEYIGNSFFPRFSVYEQLSNTGLQSLLQSEEIKSKLIELYDRKYRRYLHIDDTIDEKAEFNLSLIINGDLQLFRENIQLEPANEFDEEKFMKYYPDIVKEFSSMLITADNALDSLLICHYSINELLTLIRAELERLKN